MGDTFRRWYGQISQLRSLIPSSTPFVALTAAATHHVHDVIIRSLQMDPVQSIVLSPNRINIRYSIQKVSRDIYKTFRWLLQELKLKRTALSRIIVFCRSIYTCASLYKLFITELREDSYEPYGSTSSIQNRLFAMYHARISEDDKKQILESMVKPSGNCHVVLCTTAFGMGIDVPNIRTVIHFGPPADVDDYFQESGRAGRDGIESNAILYYYPTCLIGHVSKNMIMREYCKLNDNCRRKYLLRYFMGSPSTTVVGNIPYNCCDNCTVNCNCSLECPLQYKMQQLHLDEVHVDDQVPVRVVSQVERDQLRQRLSEFRDSVMQSLHQQCEGKPLYVGLDLVCGLPSHMVDTVVNNCEFLSDSFDVEEKCLLWNWAGDVYRIIEDVLD